MMADENPNVFRTPKVRVSYPVLFTPRSRPPRPGQAPKPPQYGATLIFDEKTKEDKTYATRMPALVQAVGLMARDRWPKEWKADGAPFFDNQSWKSPWLDGGLPKYVEKSGLGAGVRFIRPSSNRIIPCVDRKGQPITSPDYIYPGCYCYAIVAPFVYNGDENHGVSFGLRGLQFVEDGDRLDDAVDVSDYFDALDGDEMPGNEEEALKSMFKV
jgi:hypothetical protein